LSFKERRFTNRRPNKTAIENRRSLTSNMKKIVITLIAVIGLTSAYAAERFDVAAWKNVQTCDVPTLLKQEASLINRVVAVRFHYRSKEVRHRYSSWYEASIWQHDPKAKGGYSALRVVIAKPDVPAFQSITSDFHSMNDVTVYGRVEKDADTNQTHLHLLGRKITTDASGNVTVDW
jgi:hypothetical protein